MTIGRPMSEERFERSIEARSLCGIGGSDGVDIGALDMNDLGTIGENGQANARWWLRTLRLCVALGGLRRRVCDRPDIDEPPSNSPMRRRPNLDARPLQAPEEDLVGHGSVVVFERQTSHRAGHAMTEAAAKLDAFRRRFAAGRQHDERLEGVIEVARRDGQARVLVLR